MPHLVKWHKELSDSGLLVLGSHVQGGSKEQVRAKAASLGVTFTVANQARVKGGDDFSGIPHAMLFDHTGTCIYRGSPGAEKAIRAALDKAMAAGAPLGKAAASGLDNPSKAIAPHLDALAKGQLPAAVLPKLVPLLKSSNTRTAEEAKTLVHNLTATALKQIELAEARKSDDPAMAYLLIAKVPMQFRGSPAASQATTLITELKKDKAVQTEIQAQLSLQSILKIDSALSQAATKAKVRDPKDAKFHKTNAASMGQLKRALQQLNKSYPDTKATQQASVIGAKYGIDSN